MPAGKGANRHSGLRYADPLGFRPGSPPMGRQQQPNRPKIVCESVFGILYILAALSAVLSIRVVLVATGQVRAIPIHGAMNK